ncbi:DUF3095 domain-containing protein [Sulfurimonas sp. SAG-AH-194-I05]|nr:DUF3095 domain-containing protein [Sulfurimonas sp. SAG-AH-194-I05]MDF1875897.1 DUF3095 domain-containing protein [Sulfurimonas sp. SAG-AH-194-I05]
MDTFYSKLDTIDDFKEISNPAIYRQVPQEWYLVVTDVAGSTKAIESGQYKQVNMLGALTIISILNLNKNIELPFVFGGDGAFLLIPPSLLSACEQALLHLKKLALETYELSLRIGIVPIETIYKNDKNVSIAKFMVSKNYAQAVIKGGGLDFGDTLLKTSSKADIKATFDTNFTLDIDGLECRWESIPSPKDETISLLIKCDEESYYKNVLEHLDIILGNNTKRHPIISDNLNLSYDKKTLAIEGSLHGKSSFSKSLIIFKYKCINLLGDLLMKLKIGAWGNYKENIVATTDTEKFDDMLRMVLSLKYKQIENLEIYLEREYQEKNLVYGIHKADSALMTCLVFQRHGRQIHFVDSSDGGYAVAAKMLKQKMKALIS